jgi:biotin carboxylase
MEVAARLGGGHDAELCAVATGIDLNDLAIDFALGSAPGRGLTPVAEAARPGTDPSGASPRGAAIIFLVPPVGRLAEVEGVAAAEALPGVEWVRVYRRPGHAFGPLRRGVDRAGAVLATGGSREDALQQARRAADAVRFRVDADEA